MRCWSWRRESSSWTRNYLSLGYRLLERAKIYNCDGWNSLNLDFGPWWKIIKKLLRHKCWRKFQQRSPNFNLGITFWPFNRQVQINWSFRSWFWIKCHPSNRPRWSRLCKSSCRWRWQPMRSFRIRRQRWLLNPRKTSASPWSPLPLRRKHASCCRHL